ncbi:MAG: hypothetical protein IKL92_02750 [Oscillospiraceae bacterium]|nr:hypothetical protein [Oscillospiraceae bacterium]
MCILSLLGEEADELLYIVDKTIETKAHLYRINPVGGIFHNEWTNYLIEGRKDLRKSFDDKDNGLVPDEIKIQVNAYAISVAVNYCLENNVSREKMREYIRALMR